MTEKQRGRRAFFASVLLSGGAVGVLSGVSGAFTAAVCGELGISRGAFSGLGALSTLLAALTAPATAERLRRGNFRREVTIGALVCGSVPFFYSVSVRLWQFACAAAVNGLFLGRITMLAVGLLLSDVEEEHRVRALGAAFAGTGLFTAAALPLVQRAMVRCGWRQTYRLTGAAALLLLVPTACCLLPTYIKEKETRAVPTEQISVPAAATAGIFLVNLCNLALYAHAIPYLVDLGLGLYASAIVSAAMVLLVGAKIAAGHLYDRWGARRGTQALAVGIGAASLVALCLPQTWALICYPPLLAVAQTANTLPAAALAKAPSGAQDDAAYARLMRAASLGSAAGAPLAGLVFDRTGSYRMMWQIVAALSAISWILFARFGKRRGNS
jgi:predicted MFS family arabinose efflux permease